MSQFLFEERCFLQTLLSELLPQLTRWKEPGMRGAADPAYGTPFRTRQAGQAGATQGMLHATCITVSKWVLRCVLVYQFLFEFAPQLVV